MTASSVTGRGIGASGTVGIKELAILANGPSIIFSGMVESEDGVTSPPSYSNTVEFAYPLEGGADAYVVLLTTINAGYAYVTDRDEDGSGNFTGFSFATETDGTVMYLVAKAGMKANI